MQPHLTNSRPDEVDARELFSIENVALLLDEAKELDKFLDEEHIFLRQDQLVVHATEANDIVDGLFILLVDVEDAVNHQIISPPSS